MKNTATPNSDETRARALVPMRHTNEKSPKHFTLKFWMDDMGSFEQPGCQSLEDALWHINSARDHDGLSHIEMDDLKNAFDSKSPSSAHAEWIPIY